MSPEVREGEVFARCPFFEDGGAHSGGAPACREIVVTARTIAVIFGPRLGWSFGSRRPPVGAGCRHHRV